MAAFLCLLAGRVYAGPLEAFVADHAGEGVHAILGQLRGTVPTFTTNAAPARVRSADEKALVAACVAQGITKAALKAAPDRDRLIDDTLRAKLKTGTLAQQNEAARAVVEIMLIRAAIARAGNAVPGDDADEAQPPLVTRTEGPPLWHRLGLAELPDPGQIRDALDAARSANRKPAPSPLP